MPGQSTAKMGNLTLTEHVCVHVIYFYTLTEHVCPCHLLPHPDNRLESGHVSVSVTLVKEGQYNMIKEFHKTFLLPRVAKGSSTIFIYLFIYGVSQSVSQSTNATW